MNKIYFDMKCYYISSHVYGFKEIELIIENLRGTFYIRNLIN